MTLIEKIAAWMSYPNSLGSEAQAAVIVGEIANALREEIPVSVSAALRTLALRGTMRDMAAALRGDKKCSPEAPSTDDIVDVGAAASGISWTEAIATIARYLDAAKRRLTE